MKRIVTVEEASGLLCPVLGKACMAEGCMAWRWVVERESLTEAEMLATGFGIGLAAALKPAKPITRGRCGMVSEDDG